MNMETLLGQLVFLFIEGILMKDDYSEYSIANMSSAMCTRKLPFSLYIHYSLHLIHKNPEDAHENSSAVVLDDSK